MCERLAQFSSPVQLISTLGWHKEVRQQQPLQPRTSIAPEGAVGLVHGQSDCLVFDPVRWGWFPRWAKVKSPQFHAPVDKVTHSPYWKAVWQHRALCPIDGWFEWSSRGTDLPRPHYVRRRDGQACLIAAVGQFPRAGRDATVDDGFVLLVGEKRGGLVDERGVRPLILSPEVALEWIDVSTEKGRPHEIVQAQAASDDIFEWFPVDYEAVMQETVSIQLLNNR
ncbi:SOS response-associated peptidase family protein [Pseudomonas alkylphenolica]|uniref:SOS response-associated peptidase family protein n=1 Tax=Pseudomonas alkylphenolica TaxID=237609 RepID=UPI0018D9F9EA|nr:SOS response-associated peptidase family protein [Pseudomonas alkylphenolica]MBH3426354.1 SOS response-associated peptidase family protein [Pseudomonas alkylphenolica]